MRRSMRFLPDRDMFYSLREQIRNIYAMGLSMRLRLFVFFMLLVLTMVIGVASVLLQMGFFSAGIKDNKKVLENELGYLAQKLETQLGGISVLAVRLSRHLAENIENRLAERALHVEDLSTDTTLLEEIIDNEYETLRLALQEAKNSSAFMILSATVDRKGMAGNSRTGLFIEKTEPGIPGVSPSSISILRGFPGIGRRRSVPLDTQWAMEFNVADAPYYSLLPQIVAEHPASLRKLYYWQPALTFEDLSREMMLCSVPLTDSKGAVFGVCGLGVSDRFFKSTFMPINRIYNNLLCILAPLEESTLHTPQALFSGYPARENKRSADRGTPIHPAEGGLFSYTRFDGDVFLGLHKVVRLYPQDSPFADREFALVLLAPRSEVIASISAHNRELFLFSLKLLLLGGLCSFVFSHWYIRPVLRGLKRVRDASQQPDMISLTKIPEIDDLIEFLQSRSEEPEPAEDVQQDESPNTETRFSEEFFEAFIKNTKMLTRAEKNIFNLYLEGHSAQEIAGMLNLSINTIKSHNRRIFKKLRVASRKELLSYVQMLQNEGRAIS